jgi:hypothetical protein
MVLSFEWLSSSQNDDIYHPVYLDRLYNLSSASTEPADAVQAQIGPIELNINIIDGRKNLLFYQYTALSLVMIRRHILVRILDSSNTLESCTGSGIHRFRKAPSFVAAKY